MTLSRDIVTRIQDSLNIADVIEKLGTGDFRAISTEHAFNGNHGTHDSSSGTSCSVDPKKNVWHCFSCKQGGGVVEWVLSTRYKNNYNCLREAVEFIRNTFNVDLPECSPLDSARYEVYGLLTRVSTEWCEALLERSPEVLEWVKSNYGLTEKTIKDLKIGYCDKVPDVEPLAMQTSGLVNDKGEFRFVGRVTFPFIVGGSVQWIAARYAQTVPPHGVPKFYSLSSTPYVSQCLYNFDNALSFKDEEPLIITEGLADCARAYQAGLRAVSVITTTGLSEELKPGLIRVCEASNTKYIVFDSEVSNTGFNAAKNLAQKLINSGHDPIIVQLPRGEKSKVDLCDYLRDNGDNALHSLLINGSWQDNNQTFYPNTLPDLEISATPKNAEANKLVNVVMTFAALPDASCSRYITALSQQSKVPVKALQDILKTCRKKVDKVTLTLSEEWQAMPFLAQDYRYLDGTDTWRAYMTAFAPHIKEKKRGSESYEETIMCPITVTVDQNKNGQYVVSQVDRMDAPSEEEKRLLPGLKSINRVEANEFAWSFKKAAPYGLPSLIEGTAKALDLGELYREIYSLFDDYIVYPDERNKHLLTVYVFWTYIYMGFSNTSYLHMYGTKESGKSATMQMLSRICFNAIMASSITGASASRIVHSNRPTLFVDEAHALKDPTPGTSVYELWQLSLSGYSKNGGSRFVCKATTNEPEDFYAYSPKVFASTKPLENMLSSRTITVECRTAEEGKTKKLRSIEQDEVYLSQKFQAIRDKLHFWAITQFRAIREKYDSYSLAEFETLSNRNRQLWLPLFAICDVIDQASGTKNLPILLSLSEDKMLATKLEAATSDFNITVLSALYTVLNDNPHLLEMREVKSGTFLCVPATLDAVTNQLMSERMWDPKRNGLKAATLNKWLRDLDISDKTVPTATLRVGTERKTFVHFKPEALKNYIELKLGKNEAVEND